jgi:hypothetical protein
MLSRAIDDIRLQGMATRCALSKASAARALLRQDMPFGEVRAVLDADDASVVRRYLELHRERLEEQLWERRRALATIERALIERLGSESRASA